MYCIIGENVGVDKSAGTNDYSAMPRPTTSSVCKNAKDGDECSVCWGSEPTGGMIKIVTLEFIFQVEFGKCKRGICGDGIKMF